MSVLPPILEVLGRKGGLWERKLVVIQRRGDPKRDCLVSQNIDMVNVRHAKPKNTSSGSAVEI